MNDLIVRGVFAGCLGMLLCVPGYAATSNADKNKASTQAKPKATAKPSHTAGAVSTPHQSGRTVTSGSARLQGGNSHAYGRDSRLTNIQHGAQAARNMKQAGQMRDARANAMQPGAGANSAATLHGPTLGDHTPGGSQRGTASNRNGIGAAPTTDFRAGAYKSASKHQSGGFTSQPTAGGRLHIRGAGFASEDGGDSGDPKEPADPKGPKDGLGSFKDPKGRNDSGKSAAPAEQVTARQTTHQDKDGTTTTHTVYTDSSGHMVQEDSYQKNSDGSGTMTTTYIGPKGDKVTTSQGFLPGGVSDPKHPWHVVDAKGVPADSVSKPTNTSCNWNPMWGRCMGVKPASHKDTTGQPGPGQGGTGSGGNSRAPRIGNEAVTNPNEFASNPGAGNAGGHRIDIRDPGFGSGGGSGRHGGGFAP